MTGKSPIAQKWQNHHAQKEYGCGTWAHGLAALEEWLDSVLKGFSSPADSRTAHRGPDFHLSPFCPLAEFKEQSNRKRVRLLLNEMGFRRWKGDVPGLESQIQLDTGLTPSASWAGIPGQCRGCPCSLHAQRMYW